MAGFFPVQHAVLEHPNFNKLKQSGIVLYLYLCKYDNRYKSKRCYFTRSDRQIQRDSGMARTTINRARNELVKFGFIVCNSKEKRLTRYQIVPLGLVAV